MGKTKKKIWSWNEEVVQAELQKIYSGSHMWPTVKKYGMSPFCSSITSVVETLASLGN